MVCCVSNLRCMPVLAMNVTGLPHGCFVQTVGGWAAYCGVLCVKPALHACTGGERDKAAHGCFEQTVALYRLSHRWDAIVANYAIGRIAGANKQFRHGASAWCGLAPLGAAVLCCTVLHGCCMYANKRQH